MRHTAPRTLVVDSALRRRRPAETRPRPPHPPPSHPPQITNRASERELIESKVQDIGDYNEGIEERAVAFSHIDRGSRDGGDLLFSMPATTFSATALVFMTLRPEHLKSPLLLVTVVCPVLLSYAISTVFAIVCAVGVREHAKNMRTSYDEGEDPLICYDEGTWWLRHVCIIIFLMMAVNEVRDSLDMCRWLYEIPKWEPMLHERLCKKCGAGMVFRELRYVNHFGNQAKITRPVTGITLRYRRIVQLTCILPKVILELFVMHGGVAYIALADGIENILLNAAAMVFILEIDELAFRVFTTRLLQRHMEQIPAIGVLLAKSLGPIGLRISQIKERPQWLGSGGLAEDDLKAVHRRMQIPLVQHHDRDHVRDPNDTSTSNRSAISSEAHESLLQVSTHLTNRFDLVWNVWGSWLMLALVAVFELVEFRTWCDPGWHNMGLSV